jgi:hypothetical protein
VLAEELSGGLPSSKSLPSAADSTQISVTLKP